MFNQERSEENFQEVRKLLAMKRSELPSQHYFDGVLGEFHERQRAMLLQPRYSFISRLFAKWEEFKEDLLPRPAVRLAFASVAAVAVLTVLSVGPRVSTDNGMALALQQNAPTGDQFAFSQGLEPQRVSSVDQQIDAASIQPVSLDNQPVMPHYVMAQAPTSYDTTVAF